MYSFDRKRSARSCRPKTPTTEWAELASSARRPAARTSSPASSTLEDRGQPASEPSAPSQAPANRSAPERYSSETRPAATSAASTALPRSTTSCRSRRSPIPSASAVPTTRATSRRSTRCLVTPRRLRKKRRERGPEPSRRAEYGPLRMGGCTGGSHASDLSRLRQELRPEGLEPALLHRLPRPVLPPSDERATTRPADHPRPGRPAIRL
jgi:hypothetical protein